MKDEKFSIAGGGLKLMFIGQIVVLFSFVPVIGGLAALVGGIIALVGLVKTRRADPGYQRAVLMLVLSIVATVLMAFMAAIAAGGALMESGGAVVGGSLGTMVLGLAISVFGFLQVYFVCSTTAGLLREIGQDDTASKGDMVWKLNAACYAVSIIITIVTFVSAGLAGFLGIVGSLVSIVASILYIFFLFQSQKAMLE